MAVRNIIKRRRDTTPAFDPYQPGTPDYAERTRVTSRTLVGGHIVFSMGEPIK